MRTLILSILMLALAIISNAQNVNIPDANFKNALIELGVDTNEDGEISYAECEAITYLDVGNQLISDLTGIEAFVNLDTLYCNGNQLTSLDVSNNTALIDLECNGNQLTSLDVSGCSALYYLHCGNNQLTSLDVSGCSAITNLYCYLNQLTSLDVTNNNALTELSCGGNQLTSLDVTNNTALHLVELSYLPTLYEVCVWEIPFPPEYIWVDTTGSPNVYFTTDCAATELKPDKENSRINIYPNPSDGIINIEIENPNNAIMEIYDVSGTLIFSKVLNSNSESIDLSGFSEGIYLVKVKQDSTIIIEKVVVR